MSVLTPASRTAPDDVPSGIGSIAVLTLLVVLLQISLLPFIRIFDGIPDLVIALTVSVALMRGPIYGAVVGFVAGLLIELLAPVGTLGVLAVIYMSLGAFCGRYCGRPEASGLVAPIGLIVACAGITQVAYAAVLVSLGAPFSFPTFIGRVLLAQMVLTALLSPPMLLLVRKVLKQPVLVEPGAGA